LEVVVVVVDVGPELHFFDLRRLLFLLGVLLLLFLLINELSEVHDAADRRSCGRRDLDEVEPGFARLLECVGHHDDAQRFPFGADQPDLLPADLLVDADTLLIDLSPPKSVRPSGSRPPSWRARGKRAAGSCRGRPPDAGAPRTVPTA